jgi:KDO2-lipid IV(A) lauroyltransferase
VVYAVSDCFAFLVGGLIRYRFKIMDQNLRNAFPDMGDKERKSIIRKNYRHLTDLLVEAMKGFSMSSGTIQKRHKILNPEILDPFLEKNIPAIGVLGHYNNWEWGALSAPLFAKHLPVGFYKPISNKPLDQYMKRNRGRTGTHLCSIYVTALSFESYKQKNGFFMMIADQSPSNVNKAYWMNFLNQETAVLHGPEKYARQYDMPVVFVDIQKVKRGYYEARLELIAEKPNEMPDGNITSLFMQRLEESIRKQPQYWLWTHRRWKLKKETK